MNLNDLLTQIQPVDETASNACFARLDQVAKPIGSLGKLEELLARIAAVTRTPDIDITQKAVTVFCADNGVTRRGVAQGGHEVTTAIAGILGCGKASVSVMAKACGADVFNVDVGMVDSVIGLRDCKLMRGTGDMTEGPAMSREIAVKAVMIGVEMVRELKNKGYRLIATGEAGIGNTTAASAVCAVLLSCSAQEVTGRGAGLDDAGLCRKIAAIEQAITVNKPNAMDSLDVLHKVGGLDIAAMAGDRFFSIHPRRGTNTILDKKTNAQVSHETFAAMFTGGNRLLESGGTHSKGGGIVITAHRNLLLGPDAVETPDREDFSTYPESIQNIFSKQNKASKLLNQGQIITYFTGVRAPTYEEDFVVRKGLYTKNLIHAAGMQSPGVTAAPAVAEDIAAWTAEMLNAAPNEEFDPVRPAIINAAELPELERNALIRENPDYGVILCRCEQISRGEILAAMRRPLPCDSVDGIKRRVRAGMGRCQGGFCGPQVAMLIAEELKIPLEQVRKSGRGSEILFGSIKEGVSA